MGFFICEIPQDIITLGVMIIRTLNVLLALLAGIIGFGILFLIFEFIARVTGLTILDCSPFLSRNLTKADYVSGFAGDQRFKFVREANMLLHDLTNLLDK